jgi:hypothetical protein
MNFWNIEDEINFFYKSLNLFDVEQLFYKIKDRYFAYIPKRINFHYTLQSRNSIIGNYTEKWVKDFLAPIAKENNLYCLNGVVCEELGLNKNSPADVAFCKTNEKIQKAENIKAIFEVKMSIVNNYEFENNKIKFAGDLTTHKAIPSLLRSDSMLKAIGKCVNIRLKNERSFIPLFVIGNTYISKNYLSSVDLLKKRGIIQGFINLFPDITPNKVFQSPLKGFVTFTNYKELKKYIEKFLVEDYVYFSKAIKRKDLLILFENNNSKLEIFLKELREFND